MTWIQSHNTILGHPKLLHFRQLTGWDIDRCIGFLHRFWWWVMIYVETGDLTKYTDKVIGEGLGCDARVIGHLRASKWIDADGKVHDWLVYARGYLRAKYHSSNPKIFKSIVGKNKDILRTSLGQPPLYISSNLISSNKERSNKVQYAEFVRMTEVEYNKLIDKYGKFNTLAMIKKLDDAKGSKGYTYKSDYRAILSWVVDQLGVKERDRTLDEIKKGQDVPDPTPDQIQKAKAFTDRVRGIAQKKEMPGGDTWKINQQNASRSNTKRKRRYL